MMLVGSMAMGQMETVSFFCFPHFTTVLQLFILKLVLTDEDGNGRCLF